MGKKQKTKVPENVQKTIHPAHRRHRIVNAITWTLLALFVVLASLAAGFKYLAHGSLAQIYVGNAKILDSDSLLQIEDKIQRATANYKLTLQYSDGSKKSFALSATGVTIAASNSAQDAKQQLNKLLVNRLEWWKQIHLPLSTQTNQAVLSTFINVSGTQITQQPKDAGISLDNGQVVLTPQTAGHGATISNARWAIANAVSNLQTTPLVLQDAVLQPSITTSDLQSSQQKVQGILSQKIVLNIAGHSVTPSQTDIAGWIDLSPVAKDKTVDVNVDSGKILQYINNISKRYITPPRDRLVTTTDGGQVVLDPGADGVDIVNKNQTATQIANNLLADKGMNINLSVQYAAAQTVETQAYPKWIVVDVTTKRMYAYENTTLVNTFLVSAGAPKTPTVLGQYKIYAKYASQDMSGNNADGSRYFQPAVPYVNYFYGGYAIHGNYWRPASWFGNINSSHGCVGVTVSDGEWIYNWAPIGTPVITHA